MRIIIKKNWFSTRIPLTHVVQVSPGGNSPIRSAESATLISVGREPYVARASPIHQAPKVWQNITDRHHRRDIMSPLQGYWIDNLLFDRAYALSYILSPLRGLSWITCIRESAVPYIRNSELSPSGLKPTKLDLSFSSMGIRMRINISHFHSSPPWPYTHDIQQRVIHQPISQHANHHRVLYAHIHYV